MLLPSNAAIDAEIIAAAPDLRLIQQPAAGHEGVDLAAAAARAIPVCNAPGANHHSMGEAALMLMLAVARRLPEVQTAFAQREVGEPVGTELFGKTLGIIGLGRSGRVLAGAAEALGMHVVSVRSTSGTDELAALLRASDFVSVHAPLTERTRGLLGADAFQKIKRGAVLVNAARGPIVDRDAMVAALDDGTLRGVGLDVHEHEPPDPADALYLRPDVVALTHIGGSTEESYARIADIVADNVRRLLGGDALVHRVA